MFDALLYSCSPTSPTYVLLKNTHSHLFPMKTIIDQADKSNL